MRSSVFRPCNGPLNTVSHRDNQVPAALVSSNGPNFTTPRLINGASLKMNPRRYNYMVRSSPSSLAVGAPRTSRSNNV